MSEYWFEVLFVVFCFSSTHAFTCTPTTKKMAFYPNVTKCWKQGTCEEDAVFLMTHASVNTRWQSPLNSFRLALTWTRQFLKIKTETQPGSRGSGRAGPHNPRKRSRRGAEPASEEQRSFTHKSSRWKSLKVTPPMALPLPAWGCRTGSDSCSGCLEDVQGKFT